MLPAADATARGGSRPLPSDGAQSELVTREQRRAVARGLDWLAAQQQPGGHWGEEDGTKVADTGMLNLLWFLGLISANLAVINFLPLPIVDGGLFLFLCLEKIRGEPVSIKTQVATQLIGIALIITVFLLVTYQDILHWVTGA